jgi:HSP20 family protein
VPRSFWRWPSLWDEDDWLIDINQGLSVYETDDNVVVKANIAGVPADKVDVSVEGGVVTIKAEHQETEEEKKKKKAIYREAREAKYLYTTTIPCPIKADKAVAEVENGVLVLTLPKEEQAKPKKVKVKAKSK